MGLRLCQTLAWSRRQDRWYVSYIARVMGVPCRSEERATAQNGVYERAERAHVTHPFCRAPSSVYLFRWFKEPPFAFKSTTLHTQDSKAISYSHSGSMMTGASPTVISSRDGLLTRHELALDALPSSSIEKYCLLSPPCCRMQSLSFPSTY
jgi:hypothetical protein